MKIAILGIRGIPANYGGFETFAEAIAERLVKSGHEVSVYGRSNSIDYREKFYKGIRIIIFPTIQHKYLDTVAHTFLCAFHSLKESYNVILICNSANSYISFLPRIFGTPVVINVDGLEWQRAKWNKLGKLYYRVSEWLATLFANAIVTDARLIKDYYLKRFKTQSTLIPYGFQTDQPKSIDALTHIGIEPRRYVLFVSRLEPENNAHLVVSAFEKVKTDFNLVVVGDAPYNKQYIEDLKSTNDKRIIFTGYVFGKGYRELQSNAYLYVQATEVGGTHPALVEGMGFGNCILANDVPEHREVISDAGFYFSSRDNGHLVNRMQYLLDNPAITEQYRKKAYKRACEEYSWGSVTTKYEDLFKKMIKYRS